MKRNHNSPHIQYTVELGVIYKNEVKLQYIETDRKNIKKNFVTVKVLHYVLVFTFQKVMEMLAII